MTKGLFTGLLFTLLLAAALAGCASDAGKSDSALDSGSLSGKAETETSIASPAIVAPVLRVVPEILRHKRQDADNLLLDYSGCKSGLTYDDCREEADKTEAELREKAYDELSDKLLGSSGSDKRGKLRLKKDRLEWRVKF